MTEVSWWIVAVLSWTLDEDERAAVQGDLAESGETGGQALCQVLGLVARRQAAMWKGWRPWLVLIGLVAPLGLLLRLVSRRTADGSAIYLWLYANNWDWSLLSNALFRHDFAHYLGVIFIEYVTLVCWSWTSGFVLGYASRRTIPVNGVLFGLLLFFGDLPGAPPRHLGHALFYRAGDFHNNDAVFALPFYRVMFPLIVQTILVLIPSLWGIRQALRVSPVYKENQT